MSGTEECLSTKPNSTSRTALSFKHLLNWVKNWGPNLRFYKLNLISLALNYAKLQLTLLLTLPVMWEIIVNSAGVLRRRLV